MVCPSQRPDSGVNKDCNSSDLALLNDDEYDLAAEKKVEESDVDDEEDGGGVAS